MPITQSLTSPPAAPTPGENPAIFDAKVQARLAWDATNTGELGVFATQANALASEVNMLATTAVNAPGTSATSTSSVLIGTGSKSLTIQTGKSIVVGMWVVIANTANPANYMVGNVTSYDSGTGALGVNVTQVGGSGTLSAWTVSLTAPPASGQYLPLTGGSIVTNSSTDALRITQTGTGNALLVEDSANPDSTPFVINAGGRVSVGSTTYFGINGITDPIMSIASAEAQLSLSTWNGSSPGLQSGLQLMRSRGSIGSNAILINGDVTGTIRFAGDDGTKFRTSASISAVIEGTPGVDDMPGKLLFSTTPQGAFNPVSRMQIGANGNVSIGTGALPLADTSLFVSSPITGAAVSYGIRQSGEIKSDVTTQVYSVISSPSTQAASFNLGTLQHFLATQGFIGAGSTITNQSGFHVSAALVSATNNFGFYSNIPAGTGRWNFYAIGTASNYFGGDVIQKLSASVTPANNSEMMMQLTSNTQLTIKVKGTDGIVRSANITLA